MEGGDGARKPPDVAAAARWVSFQVEGEMAAAAAESQAAEDAAALLVVPLCCRKGGRPGTILGARSADCGG